MAKVECPCCHGDKVIVVYEHGKIPGIEIETIFVDCKECTHCEGKGVIEAEVGEKDDGDSPSR